MFSSFSSTTVLVGFFCLECANRELAEQPTDAVGRQWQDATELDARELLREANRA